MTYKKKIFIILITFFILFEAKAQTIKETLKPKPPLDKFNAIASFVSNNKSDANALAKAGEYINKNGSNKDKLYFEFSVKRIQKLGQKELLLSQQLAFLESYFSNAQKQEDHFFLSVLYEHKAQTFRMANEFAKALENYLYAADEASKDESGEYFKNSFLFYEMGLQFFEFKDYQKSLKFGLIAHQTKYHNDPNKAENWLAKANTNLIGESYRKLNKPDSALLWYQECIKQSQGKFTNDTLWQGIVLSSIAGIYYDQKKYDEALKYYLQSKSIHQHLGIYLNDHNINTFSDIAQIYMAKNEPTEALTYLLQAKTHLPKKEFNASALHYYKTMVEYYKFTKGNERELLASLDSLNVYHNIVEKELDIKQKINTEADIAYAKQFAQTKIAEEKYKKSQLLFYGTLIVLLLFTTITILYIKRRNLRHKLQQQKVESEKEKAKEALLSAQKQLEDFAKNIQEKNNLIEQFTQEIESLKIISNEKISEKESIITKLKESVILTEEDWSNYKILFEKVYPSFSENLKQQYPTITQGELRYLMFSKLNLSNKEMAALLGISLEAIRNLKFRVKQKMGDELITGN